MSSAEDAETSPLDKAKQALSDLRAFRDTYFTSHSIQQACNKEKDVKAEVDKTLDILKELIGDMMEKSAEAQLLKGAVLNVKSGFDAEAETLLARAVKRDPHLTDAWTELGECYWKKGDVNAAKDCFEGALNHGKNKVALRNLSMALRQVGNDKEELSKNIAESISKAKEAVQMDISDGTSWWILGNAYLSLFFASAQEEKTIKQCISAYQQAEKDVVAMNNPDLHFNRAIAYKYQEEYEMALLGLLQAKALDPTWEEPQKKLTALTNYLHKVNEMIKTKGKQRPKKVRDLAKSIKASSLGPYGGGSYTSPLNKTIALEQVPLESLQLGLNSQKVVLGKVVCSVAQPDPVPYTFCLMDAAETCHSVTLYNVDTNYGLHTGDSVAIAEPFLHHVKFLHQDEGINYCSIRVDTPLVLVVNGRKLGLEKQAPIELAIDNNTS